MQWERDLQTCLAELFDKKQLYVWLFKPLIILEIHKWYWLYLNHGVSVVLFIVFMSLSTCREITQPLPRSTQESRWPKIIINSKGMDLFRDCLTNINAHIWKLETFLRQILLKTLPNWNHKHIGKIMETTIFHSIFFTKIVDSITKIFSSSIF